MPKTHVKMMPQRMLPRTFLAMRIPVNRMPNMDRRTVMPTELNVPDIADCLNENKAIFVAGLPTMIWALNRPIKAMNKPIPADTAFFRLKGIALKMASRTFVRDNIMKMTPSTQTAAKAISQV